MKHSTSKIIGVVTSFALLCGGLAVPPQRAQAAGKKVSISKKVTVTVGKTRKINLKNNQKKVKWKITKGKKLIKITKKSKKSATIRGVKRGTAKVQAVVGKKSYTCTVKITVLKKNSTEGSKPETKVAEVPEVTLTPTGNISATSKPTATGNTTVTPTATPEDDITSKLRTIVYDGTNINEIQNAEDPIKVIVQEGITSIGEKTFYGCQELSSIEIPDSVTKIEGYAFYGCVLCSVW